MPFDLIVSRRLFVGVTGVHSDVIRRSGVRMFYPDMVDILVSVEQIQDEVPAV